MSEITYDIEKVGEIKERAQQDKIVFDNQGKMHADNREYRRDAKRLWRSVIEGQKSIRCFTKKKTKTSKASKKMARQNRKKGRK